MSLPPGASKRCHGGGEAGRSWLLWGHQDLPEARPAGQWCAGQEPAGGRRGGGGKRGGPDAECSPEFRAWSPMNHLCRTWARFCNVTEPQASAPVKAGDNHTCPMGVRVRTK